MIDHDSNSRADAPRSFAQSYATALATYVRDGNEENLSRAYDCARQALQSSISIGQLGELHFQAAQTLCSGSPSPSPETKRTEEFYLEAISVYDMALRGYGESVAQLTAEVLERKRAEQELRDVTYELARQRDSLDQQVKARTRELQAGLERSERLNSQLQQANQEQAQFTYAISHDLKSPINTIAMLLDIISVDHQEHLDSECLELIDAAQATASRMSRMITGILQYARLVGQEAEFETVSLDKLCRDVRDDLRQEITAGKAEIDISQLPDVRGMPSQLRSLLQNLLSNAIKFRDPARSCRIAVSAAPKPRNCAAEITVSDTGIGIPEAYRTRIFSLFQRLHTYDEYSGSGIGLTLCQRIAGYHAGDIQVVSNDEGGSSFIVRLWINERERDNGTQSGDDG